MQELFNDPRSYLALAGLVFATVPMNGTTNTPSSTASASGGPPPRTPWWRKLDLNDVLVTLAIPAVAGAVWWAATVQAQLRSIEGGVTEIRSEVQKLNAWHIRHLSVTSNRATRPNRRRRQTR